MADKMIFAHSRYLGGAPGQKAAYDTLHNANLVVDLEGIGCGVRNHKKGVLLWKDATGISYDTDTISKSRVGKAMLIGVLALAAKNTQAATTITITLKEGGPAFYQVKDKTAREVRGRIDAIVSAAGVPCIDDVINQTATPAPVEIAAPSSNSVADELGKLAALRDAGIITDDEFAAQKAKLLA